MNDMGGEGIGLWDEQDGFYYDVLHLGDSAHIPMKVRSMVGLIPLFAVETFEPEDLARAARISRAACSGSSITTRTWREHVDMSQQHGAGRASAAHDRQPQEARAHLPLRLRRKRISLALRRPRAFEISRATSVHARRRRPVDIPWTTSRANPRSDLFGGNSNWRGPVWFPMNFLLIESMQRIHYYYGDDFKVECPTGSGQQMNLWDAASELSRRLSRHFSARAMAAGPSMATSPLFQDDPYWRDLILFYEYFHGETGAGLGASHQTGLDGAGRQADRAERRIAFVGTPRPVECGNCPVSEGAFSWAGRATLPPFSPAARTRPGPVGVTRGKERADSSLRGGRNDSFCARRESELLFAPLRCFYELD